MAGNVTEAQSHDEGRGGKNVTGVHRSVTGLQNTTVNGGREMQ